jgi:hypothetical protein
VPRERRLVASDGLEETFGVPINSVWRDVPEVSRVSRPKNTWVGEIDFPKLRRGDAMTRYYSFVINGSLKGMLRRVDDGIPEAVQGGRWVVDPAAMKYWEGFAGLQLDIVELTADQAVAKAAQLGVELDAPVQQADVSGHDRLLKKLFPDEDMEDFVVHLQPQGPPRP